MDIIMDYFVQLRKELLEAQKIRAQVIGFKITLVSGAFGLVFANADKVDATMFVLPALSAICFDFLINSYSFSVKRIGTYIREYIEPALAKHRGMPKDFIFWQVFLTQPKTKQNLAHYGNLGLTILSALIAINAIFTPYRKVVSSVLLVIILVSLIFDVLSFLEPAKLGKQWGEKDFDKPARN